MRAVSLRLALVLGVMVGLLIPARAAYAFQDVPGSYWDYDAITWVATTNDWMLDYNATKFKPTVTEKRRHLARTLVKIYAPAEPTDPTITFPDLPDTDPYYPYANVAVKLGWISTQKGGVFNPNGTVPTSLFDMALILATGQFADAVTGLSTIHMADGTPYPVAARWPYWQLAHWMGLHYNHDDEGDDIQLATSMPRDEVAYSIWAMTTMDSWQIDSASVFEDVELPTKSGHKQAMTQFALDQVGYPYIWAGEWSAASPPGYCCGTQPQGGMDCSGFVWFVTKKNEGGYNAAQFHPAYPGWTLPERSSSTMAQATPTHLKWADLGPGDLMFVASNGGNTWQDVDHVGIYLGNDWMMHSTGGGPQLQYVGSGYYKDNFVWGRDLLESKAGPHGRIDSPLGGDPAVGPAFPASGKGPPATAGRSPSPPPSAAHPS